MCGAYCIQMVLHPERVGYHLQVVCGMLFQGTKITRCSPVPHASSKLHGAVL
jgi:hypothetical protein